MADNERQTPQQIEREKAAIRRIFGGNFTEFRDASDTHSGERVYKSSGQLVKERNERLAILKRMKSNGKLMEKEFAEMVVFVRRRYNDFVEQQVLREVKGRSYENPVKEEDLAAVSNALKGAFNLSDGRVLSKLMEEYGEDIAAKITGKSIVEAEKIIKSEVSEIKEEVVEAIIEDVRVEQMEEKEAIEAISEAIKIIGEPQTESQREELAELEADKKELESSDEFNLMKTNPENQNWYDQLKEVYYGRIKRYEEIISDPLQDPKRRELAEEKKSILESVQIENVGNLFKVGDKGNNVLKSQEDIFNEQNLVIQFFESEFDYKEVAENGDTLDANSEVYFENQDDRINFANVKNMYSDMIGLYGEMNTMYAQMQTASSVIDSKAVETISSLEAESETERVMTKAPKN